MLIVRTTSIREKCSLGKYLESGSVKRRCGRPLVMEPIGISSEYDSIQDSAHRSIRESMFGCGEKIRTVHWSSQFGSFQLRIAHNETNERTNGRTTKAHIIMKIAGFSTLFAVCVSTWLANDVTALEDAALFDQEAGPMEMTEPMEDRDLVELDEEPEMEGDFDQNDRNLGGSYGGGYGPTYYSGGGYGGGVTYGGYGGGYSYGGSYGGGYSRPGRGSYYSYSTPVYNKPVRYVQPQVVRPVIQQPIVQPVVQQPFFFGGCSKSKGFCGKAMRRARK